MSVTKIETLIERLHFLLLTLVAATLPFPSILLNSALTIATFCVSLLYFAMLKRDTARFNRWFLLFVLLYMISLLGFMRSTTLSPVLFDLEQKLSLLAFPLIFALGPPYSSRRSKIIILTFVMATLMVTLLSFKNLNTPAYSYFQLYQDLLLHRPYLGMYCVFGGFFCLYGAFHTASVETRISYIVAAVLLFVVPVILIAKMAVLVSVAVGCVCVFVYLLQRRRYVLTAAFSVALLVAVGYATLINDKGRAITENVVAFSTFKEQEPGLTYSFNIRVGYWRCAWRVIFTEDHWLFGVGTSEAYPALSTCYSTKDLGFDKGGESDDPHNQYLLVWLTFGLVPLIFFVFSFLALLYRYLKEKNLLALAFTLIVMLSCVTEPVMENQKGIVFYALFQCLFMFGGPFLCVRRKDESDALTP